MTGRDNIIRMARQAGFDVTDQGRASTPYVVDHGGSEELERFAELVAAPLLQRIAELTGAQLPTVEDIESQNWERVDGAVAWHLVDRHAEDWAHTARLMHAWRDAAVAEAIRARGQHG